MLVSSVATSRSRGSTKGETPQAKVANTEVTGLTVRIEEKNCQTCGG